VWLRRDIDESKVYRVALRQELTGRRSFHLLLDRHEVPVDAVLYTEVVPTDLLLRREFHGISKAVKLTSRESFRVDAHGIWFTRAEAELLGDVE
jgi:hypothetical protein